MQRLLSLVLVALLSPLFASSALHNQLALWSAEKAQLLLHMQPYPPESAPIWIANDAWQDYQAALEQSGNRKTLLADGMEIETNAQMVPKVTFDVENHLWQVLASIETTYTNLEWVQQHKLNVALSVKANPMPPLKRSEQFVITHVDIKLAEPVSVEPYQAKHCINSGEETD